MSRRRAVPGLVVSICILLTPVAASPPEAMNQPRVAFLGAESPLTSQHFLDAFREGLRERGYVDGQNIMIEARWAEGRVERFSNLVDELVRLKVKVIVAVSAPAAVAAKKATLTIPIVFIAGDPVSSGLVSSFGHPGGNITGVSLALGEEFTGKWLELLREAVPGIARIAVLLNPANPANAGYLKAIRVAAEQLRVKLQLNRVRQPDELAAAFTAMTAAQAEALVVLTDPLTVRYRAEIVELAAKSRLPAMYGFREFVDAGGLMAYGSNVPYMCGRAAVYVEKILKGAKPGDLPVEQPTNFQLTINLKTAKTLGLTIPQLLLIRADDLIQ